MTRQNSPTNQLLPTKYMVAPTAAEGVFTTIAGAIAAAVADGASGTAPLNIHVKAGTYNESITLSDGIYVLGLDDLPFYDDILQTQVAIQPLSVVLTGKVTVQDGKSKLNNFEIKPAAGSCIEFTGTTTTSFYCTNVSADIADTSASLLKSGTGNVNVYMDNSQIGSNIATGTLVSNTATGQFLFTVNSSALGHNGNSALQAGSIFAITAYNSYIRQTFSSTTATCSIEVHNTNWSGSGGVPLISLTTGIGSLTGYNSILAINGGSNTNFFESSNGSSSIRIRNSYLSNVQTYSCSGTVEMTSNSIAGSTAVSSGNVIRAAASGFSGSLGIQSQGSVQTVNVSTQTIATIALQANEAMVVDAEIIGTDSGFTGATGGTVSAVVRRAGAGAVLVGAPTSVIYTSLVGGTFTVSVSGNNMIITVTGIALTTINWTCTYTLTKVQTNT